MTRSPGAEQPVMYQIKVRGQLDEKWSEWFSDMMVTFDSDITTLTGAVADQAALRGMLSKIWDLNLTLISVNPVTAGSRGEPRAKSEARDTRL